VRNPVSASMAMTLAKFLIRWSKLIQWLKILFPLLPCSDSVWVSMDSTSSRIKMVLFRLQIFNLHMLHYNLVMIDNAVNGL